MHYDIIENKLCPESKNTSSVNSKLTMYSIVKENVITGKIKLPILNIDTKSNFVNENASSHESRLSDGDQIMNKLYSKGWPIAGTRLYSTDNRDGVPARMDLITSYSYSEPLHWLTCVVGTSVTVVAAYFGLDVKSVLSIGSFVYTATDGLYKLVTAQDFRDYNAYAYESKRVYIYNSYQYQSSRTVKWKMVVADGAADNFKYNHYDGDYYDNNKIFDAAYNNYNNY